MQFEFEAGVVVEAAAERGRKPRLPRVDAARSHEADAAFELVDRGGDVEFGVIGQRAQLRDRIVGIAGDSQEALDG